MILPFYSTNLNFTSKRYRLSMGQSRHYALVISFGKSRTQDFKYKTGYVSYVRFSK